MTVQFLNPMCPKKVRSRLLAAIDIYDTNVVFDMRNLTHEEDETKFDDFFNEVKKFINEYELKALMIVDMDL